ncbi:unnamed protein product [Microthlaspi erraticum]|uniref:F-box domain-containing protein n=1 Tax=Microthlaspi erraticum TaxID=1685480 RepID=A0A6D2JMM7_9BRAS|nr:unnamed protein product [Microthlaspi erraticum]
MGEDVENPNSINTLVDDLLEEIFVRLPLKSILISKTVSKRWRSILESKKFVDLRMSLQKSRKIIAVHNCDCREKPRLLHGSQLKGDEEIVYIHCDATRPLMTCDGLVCIPEQYGINVLNPWTRQLGRFSYGTAQWSSSFSLGFGRDKVTGSYKVVKMEEIRVRHRDPVVECSVLDVETGVWWMLSPSPYKIAAGSRSVCVNGSIYWLNNVGDGYKILPLDLHKEEFHNVTMVPVEHTTQETQISNLENHLAITITYTNPQWKLEIWRMDKEEERRWSKSYSISLAGKGVPWDILRRLFTPVAVSKQGNLVFHDNHKRLFKYYPETDKIRFLSSDTCVISPFLENLAPLALTSDIAFPRPRMTSESRSRCRLFFKPNQNGRI